MTIKTIQKVIKVGTSLAVTIPAKDARHAGITPGKNVELTVKLADNTDAPAKITQEYQAFRAQYGDTLKNLADR